MKIPHYKKIEFGSNLITKKAYYNVKKLQKCPKKVLKDLEDRGKN